MNENDKIQKLANGLCAENNVELMYLCKFGSHLYGTNTPESDSDYKGIFLPSAQQCYLLKAPKSLNYNNGAEGRKNTKDDVDLQLWSLQYFLELVSKGETNALDLLYSPYYREMVVYEDHWFNLVYGSHSGLFDIRNCKAFLGYAIGQARKYGIKGSRLGAIKKVYEFLKAKMSTLDDTNIKVSEIITELVTKCYDSSYCFEKDMNDDAFLVLCGSKHSVKIRVSELYDRVRGQYEVYGERAKLAEKNLGVDWKALSHAIRALVQMDELINTGKIHYPLSEAPTLCRIKQGKLPYKVVEKMIITRINEIDNKLKNLVTPLNVKNQGLINSLIIDQYTEGA